MTTKASPLFGVRSLVATSMMVALTVVMALTPIGMIRLPLVSITIAHVPIIIAALVLGLKEGLMVSFAFGATSLFLALTAPTAILDPFFVNPLISILPRMMIPVTTYFTYRGLRRLLKFPGANAIATGASIVIGNLTNTFGVYFMLYVVYAGRILEQTGQPAIKMIITAISTTTLIKCVGVLAVTLPLVLGINRAMKRMAR